MGNIGGSGHNWNLDTKCSANVRTQELSKLGEFKKLTHEFEKAVIQAIGNPDTTIADIREMHKVWEDGVLRIFPPDPAILRLLEDYQQDVATMLDFYFDGELHQHDLKKQFRQLTHAVATEVLTIAHEGFMDH